MNEGITDNSNNIQIDEIDEIKNKNDIKRDSTQNVSIKRMSDDKNFLDYIVYKQARKTIKNLYRRESKNGKNVNFKFREFNENIIDKGEESEFLNLNEIRDNNYDITDDENCKIIRDQDINKNFNNNLYNNEDIIIDEKQVSVSIEKNVSKLHDLNKEKNVNANKKLFKNKRINFALILLVKSIKKSISKAINESIDKPFINIISNFLQRMLIIFQILYFFSSFFTYPFWCYTQNNKLENCSEEIPTMKIFIVSSILRPIVIVIQLYFLICNILKIIIKKGFIINMRKILVSIMNFICIIDLILSMTLSFYNFPYANFFLSGIIIILQSRFLRNEFQMYLQVLLMSANYFILLSIVILFFTNLGLIAFQDDNLIKDNNYSNFFTSLITTIDLLNNNFEHLLCHFDYNIITSLIYLFTFIMLNNYMLQKLLIAIIYHYYQELKVLSTNKIIEDFQNEYNNFFTFLDRTSTVKNSNNNSINNNEIKIDEETKNEDNKSSFNNFKDLSFNSSNLNESLIEVLKDKKNIKDNHELNKIYDEINKKVRLTNDEQEKFVELLNINSDSINAINLMKTKNIIYNIDSDNHEINIIFLNKLFSKIRMKIVDFLFSRKLSMREYQNYYNSIKEFYSQTGVEILLNIINLSLFSLTILDNEINSNDSIHVLLNIIPSFCFISEPLILSLFSFSSKESEYTNYLYSIFLNFFLIIFSIIYLVTLNSDFLFVVEILLILRSLRFLNLLRKIREFELIFDSIIDLSSVIFSQFLSLIMFVYIYNTITMIFLAGKIKIGQFDDFDAINNEFYFYNYNGFFSSMLTSIIMIIHPNLAVLKAYSTIMGEWVLAYFSILNFIASSLFLRLFTTILLEVSVNYLNVFRADTNTIENDK